MLLELISEHQSGFILGRNILDNVSIAWLAKDWLPLTLFATLFLKLDYKKAFDRVDHSFLWEALAKIGSGDKFIMIVKGLVLGVLSKLHVNGCFSDGIEVGWGVR